MKPDDDVWREHDRWNAILAEVLFPPQETPAPVYIDLEPETLTVIGERAGVAEDAVVDALARAVASTVDLESANGFREHRARLSDWRTGTREGTYPLIALLAVFSLAAERMASGDGMSASNYYGRLSELLGGTTEKLGHAYRRDAEPFWGGLNLWLTTVGGERGLPTAYSVGLRYVGLAVSQALVREADRRRLERFFAHFDLSPRSDLPPSELVPLLGSWIDQTPSPASQHLVKLWRKESLQDRVAEVAATLLSEWNGVEDSDDTIGENRGRAQLTLSLKSFPRRSLRVVPQFFLPEPTLVREVVLRGEQDERVRLEARSLGVMGFAEPGLVDAESLLEGVLTIEDELAGTVTRYPRGLVVFKRDDLTASWVEVKQVLMGDDVIVLVADRIKEEASAVLNEVARPGWTEEGSLDGVPEGWTLVRDIEVFSRPLKEENLKTDLRALIPLTSSQLKLAGGFSLPGHLRNRWHVMSPPELRAVTDSDEPFTVKLFDLGPVGEAAEPQELEEWPDDGTGSVVQALDGLDLEDGEYAVELSIGEVIRSRKVFSLRSSDTPDEILWSRAPSIAHGLGDALSAVGAGPEDAAGPLVQGVLLEEGATNPGLESTLPDSRPWWRAATDQERTRSIRLARPDLESCFYTGSHHFDVEYVPVDTQGRPLAPSSMGTCRDCNLQKRYSSSFWRNKKKHERNRARAEVPRVDVAVLPSVLHDDLTVDDHWDIALDALRYAGGGPISTLERIARQIDPSRVFITEFISTLEALGHIEIRRSPETLAPEGWEVCPTTIVDAGGQRVLTGYWSHELIAGLEGAAEEHGHRVDPVPMESGPTLWGTSAGSAELLEWLDIGEVILPGRAGLALAGALPRLSEVVARLPRRRAGAHAETQWFDPTRASWVDVVGMEGPGAYRVGRYSTTYYLRTEADLADDTAALGDVYLVKHAATAMTVGRTLSAYSPQSRDLAVPLGANLPGLYQRAVVLDSGRAPQKRRGYLVYGDVSPEVVGRITYLLTN
ncbi:hypothetical protein ACFWFR_03400 [Oerskovia sp. NPDC060287]|uniref:hypothetical protein n=1 Tax=Oerskovia sp. NPDC060287 TaxID=3347095 RepID=UPI0036685B7E